ncbi:DUF1540 domain-containing protein [Dielma fastidiosa]|uniref:DUF1540 domain-containing protein n=1 Tax=Dielma fastidiosa TaxID=1034346 RepID=A0A318KM41_9FIRM|nr:DUF1540 domain-containing protein [Dielma fastidiosa]MBS6167941.1 DUF1540 domain-containing protein [Bacillota bacterium]MDY5168058.1 DUF1540 domain-containing protein [Dielma fastidiosa]PXX76925.1 uncharacterized protein DUF1540 [Dielma fastidiosa]
MEKKTNINCRVDNCIFNEHQCCCAHEITVGCQCGKADCCQQTECDSFKRRG